MPHEDGDAFLRLLKQNWDKLWQTAVWLGSLILLAVAAPPRFLGSGMPSDTTIKVAELVLAVCVGFCFFLIRNSNRLYAPRKYAFAAIAFVALGTILFVIYQFQFDAWTCTFDGRGPVTIGTSLQPAAAKWVETHPGANCQYLLMVSGSLPDTVWNRDEIIYHHVAMIVTFLVSVISLAIAVLMITFAVTEHVDRRTSA